MKKEMYENLELNIVKFETEDVILMRGLHTDGDLGEINPDLGGDELG